MDKTPNTFEEVMEGMEEGKQYPFCLMHYAFLFRRFDHVWEKFQEFSMENMQEQEVLKKQMTCQGPTGYEWITPAVCAAWNMYYIKAYDEKHGSKIAEYLKSMEEVCETIESHRPLLEYTDIVDPKENRSVFDVVWEDRQPMLDVVSYEKQRIAAKQVTKHGYSIVLDEVGTGKTVTALYAMRDVIEKHLPSTQEPFFDTSAKILIVCPYNKREDWQNDIRRQLGRYAHIVEQSDDGEIYKGRRKRYYFRDGEQIIFICGQKQSSKDKNGSASALKGTMEEADEFEPSWWDLVIIDEAHFSFHNYDSLRTEKAMLLTATPIVVNAKDGTRTLREYQELLKTITQNLSKGNEADPIMIKNPGVEDCFVNWFREDMGRESVKREIRFVECEREVWREDLFAEIKKEKGTLAALTFDQDDKYLSDRAQEMIKREELSVSSEVQRALDKYEGENKKLEKLVECLQENNRSYLIFCEHKTVADAIYDRLKDKSDFENAIIAIKTGGREDCRKMGSIEQGQLLNSLIQQLRSNKRVLLVLTGKIGGTGLNLGEFDGVIHYELPFTSIELEQRFGRVDRMDTKPDSDDTSNHVGKDMVFLVNKCEDGDCDSVVNRMLYYCTTKIDITCQHMPIRNTVLFYPEMIRRQKEGYLQTFQNMQKWPEFAVENEKRLRQLRTDLKEQERLIKESAEWEKVKEIINVSGSNEKFSKLCDKILEDLSFEQRLEELEINPEEFFKLIKDYVESNKAYQNQYELFRQRRVLFVREKKSVNRWLAGIGKETVDEGMFFCSEEKEDRLEEDRKSEESEEQQEKQLIGRLKTLDPEDETSETETIGTEAVETESEKDTVFSQISDIVKKIERETDINLSGKEYTEGIFWYDKEKRKLQRATVKEYREQE